MGETRTAASSKRNRAVSQVSIRSLHCAFALLLVTVACREAERPTAPQAPTPEPVVDRSALPTGADLLLITIDTLRHDALGFAAGHDATPTIDRLAATGRVFPRAYAHNVVTLPSHANILTGLYPYQHGVRDNSGFILGQDVPTLATLLKAQGFVTAAFVGAFPLDARFGLARGFDRYDDRYHVGRKSNEFAVEARRGDSVVGGGLDWWHEHEGQRRFLWLHLYDPHSPYDPPEPFARRFAEDLYLGEVAAVDHYLEPILGPLLSGGETSTLVVFTSDHGEALGEHGEQTHGLFAYDETLRVPLILWGPGIRPGEDLRTVGHVDLLPTLLDLLGVDPPRGLPGRSLLAAGQARRDLYFEALSAYLNRGWAPLYGLVRDTAKYVDLPVPELYDLASDPHESVNLVDGERRLYRELRAALPQEARQAPSRRLISDEEAAKLRSLGYLATAAQPKARFGVADDPKNLIDLDRKLHQMTDLASAGRLGEAAELGRELLAERPEMSLGYLRLSQVLRELGRFQEAIDLMRQGLAQGLEQPAILRELGLTLAESGQAQEAALLLEPLARGGDLKTLNALGVAYFTAGRLDSARTVLLDALAQDPDNLRALESLGAVMLRLEDPASAVLYLDRALAINPELPIAWNTLGVAHHWQGDVDGAIDAWQRAVSLDPALLDAWYNLGRVATQEERWELAGQAFEEYVARAPAEHFPQEVESARRVLSYLARRPSPDSKR